MWCSPIYEIVAGKRDSFGKSECGEVLKKFYDAVAKRDLAAARTYLADDLAFVGLVQTYRSADQYLKALAGLLQVTVRLDVKGISSQGNDAAIFFDLETKAPADGKVLVAEWHQFKDGKIFSCPICVRWPALRGDVYRRGKQIAGPPSIVRSLNGRAAIRQRTRTMPDRLSLPAPLQPWR
jgi:hypothetical protein